MLSYRWLQVNDIGHCCCIIIIMSVSLSFTFQFNFNQQYRCASAFYFTSTLSYKHKIVISRLIYAPGHGELFVDGLNASSKTKLTLESAKHLKAAELVMIQSESLHHIPWLMELVFQLLLSAKEC